MEANLKEITLNVLDLGLEATCTRFPETLEYLDIRNMDCPTSPQGLKVLTITTPHRLIQFPPNLEHPDYSILTI